MLHRARRLATWDVTTWPTPAPATRSPAWSTWRPWGRSSREGRGVLAGWHEPSDNRHHRAVIDQLEVLRLLGWLNSAEAQTWVDGGWGVDALLQEQNREHSDLDLVVNREHLADVMSILCLQGFTVIRDWLPNAIAFRDSTGAEVDLHPVDITLDGGGDQIQLDGKSRWHYSPPVHGVIAGSPVLCCSLQDQFSCHQGYEPRDHDRADVARLAARFGVPLPEPYDRASVPLSSPLD